VCDFGASELAIYAIATTVFTTGLSLASQYQQIQAGYDAQVKQGEYRNKLYEQQMDQANDNLERQTAWQAGYVGYQDKLYLENADAATSAYVEEQAAVNQKISEADDVASQDLQDIRRSAQERVGQALASNQFSGMNLDAILGDTYRQEGRYKDAVMFNLESTRLQGSRQKDSLLTTAKNRINSFSFNTPQPAQVNYPTMQQSAITPQVMNWGSALGNIGSSVFGAFSNFATKDPKTGKYSF